MPPAYAPNAADLIARRLYAAGCRHAFGIPGGEVLTLVEALGRAGIEFLLARHENAAGFMAEGVHHMTGAPAVLVATLGPGAANAVNVVANAEQDRVPLIVITGCVDAEEALGYSHQVIDQQALFAPITKASFRVPAGAAALVADKAVRIALEDRPGPVHLDLPIGVAATPQPGHPGLGAPARDYHGSGPVAPAEGPALAQARRWLTEAERPLMIAGLDVLAHRAEAAVHALSRDFGVPLITSYKAKGVVPEDEPLALGGAGLSPIADQELLPLIRAADLVLLAGYDPIEMRAPWREVWDPARQRVVELAAAPNRHDMHRAGLDALSKDLEPRATWPAGEPAAVKQRLAAGFDRNEAWGPAAVVQTLRAGLPRDAVATVDSGAHRILLSQLWECYGPRGLLQSTGLCTMGCALPLAIGAKLAAPGRAVVAVTGDAGLEMVLGELATLRDLGLPLVVVVFVDASLALIELKQRAMGLANRGVDFQPTDHAGVARAMGGEGVTVDSRAALAEALERALAAETFTVIACRIARGAYDGRL